MDRDNIIFIFMWERIFSIKRNVTSFVGQTKKESVTSFVGQGEYYFYILIKYEWDEVSGI